MAATMTSSETNELFFDVQQKTDKQHILDNPDTYIGSVEIIDSSCWLMNETKDKIVEKTITYVPGLFKLFDEGIVNCRDHAVRMNDMILKQVPKSLPVTYIEVEIKEDGTIIMTNDGNGIDVVKHPEYGTWVPELIFGHLRTSTNYDKTEKRIVGGKNGFGFKLMLIWSLYGSVETVDHIRGLKYIQEFKQNLDEICTPKITKATKSKPYTKITFRPDYARLGVSLPLSSDMLSLFEKRTYDISAVTDKSIKVKYNSSLIPVKNFEQYIHMYIGDKTSAPRAYEESNPRWEYAVALTPTNEFIQVSFVNGIYTSKGGKHVEYVLSQITRKLGEYIEKKKKVKVNPNSIKEQLILFIRCDIENPTFDSQTKDYMSTPSSKFGSKCEVSDKFIEKIAKMGVMEAACAITEIKETKEIKKTDGSKTRTIKGIPKLDDANWAGTDKSKDCMIILCEGDSAKTGVISGLSPEDRNIIGVNPLRGKVMNVRGKPSKAIYDNKEIADIKKILGLESGREYKTMEDVHKHLRYSKVVLMTDQDLDGSHIKGLCINLFQNEWASLTKIPGFIGFMNTPILKAKKGQVEHKFYNEGEYQEWKATTNTAGWVIKYYKGLGTSTKAEFREYFHEKRLVGFEHNGEQSDDAIDMVFNKKRADERKTWLGTMYNRNSFMDTRKTMIPYEEFIHKELIHFSKYDCDRSIPCLMDGLKISLRKILYCAFKKPLNAEIKVAQFSGYVSENACYHHGEESLNKAIIGMAQNFVGSNNINLLFPSGQFGSRIEGGQDASSPRYLFTRLEKITRVLFPAHDDSILTYLDDDGTSVEPQFYVPIIPMVLVNGCNGIGTGFSTEILCYNPTSIIAYLRHKLKEEDEDTDEDKDNKCVIPPFYPYYEGFTGTISRVSDDKFLFKGKYENVDVDTIRVTELPVGFWIGDFKKLLDDLQNDKDKDGKKITPIVKEVSENYTDVTIDCLITFSKGKLQELESAKEDYDCNGVEKVLKLYSTKTTTNMNLFDANDNLKKYDKVEHIIDDYYKVRLDYYARRKREMIRALSQELMLLTNRVRYIQEILDGSIDLRRKSKKEIKEMLQEKRYDVIDGSKGSEDSDGGYEYLVKMRMDSVTEENVTHLNMSYKQKQQELNTVTATSIAEMWETELDALEVAYCEYREARIKSQQVDVVAKKTTTKKTKTSKTTKTTK